MGKLAKVRVVALRVWEGTPLGNGLCIKSLAKVRVVGLAGCAMGILVGNGLCSINCFENRVLNTSQGLEL